MQQIFVEYMKSWFCLQPKKKKKNQVDSDKCNTQVHRNTINNSQKVEASQMSISRWKDKQIVIYMYNAVLLSQKKKWSTDACYMKDGKQKETRAAEDEMVGQHHQLNGHDLGQTLGDSER